MAIQRVLVCPQEFKGSLNPFQAAAAIAAGIRTALPHAEIIERPLADGGPGTAAIIASATGGQSVPVTVRGAFANPVTASLVLVDDPAGRLAVVESATAVGLTLTPPEHRNPALASTEGIGDLILHAAELGATRLLICVGGTGSSDGGSGLARALGLRLLDRNGRPLPPGGIHLARLATIEDHVPPHLHSLAISVAVDARNPLTGPEGAVAVFGTQKGMPDWQAPALDAALRHWAEIVRTQLPSLADRPAEDVRTNVSRETFVFHGREIDRIAGAGTGGGITAGVLAALPQATVESGAELVGRAVGLEALIAAADLVVTGEGALDAQTAYGKTVSHVAELAAQAGVPCLAVAGMVESRPPGIADAEALATSPSEVDAAIADALRYAEAAAHRLAQRWIAHHEA